MHALGRHVCTLIRRGGARRALQSQSRAKALALCCSMEDDLVMCNTLAAGGPQGARGGEAGHVMRAPTWGGVASTRAVGALLTALTLQAGLACTPAEVKAQRRTATPAAQAAPVLTAEQQVERAAAAFDAGRYEEAITSYRIALGSEATRARAELGLRRVQLEVGDYANAAQPPQYAEGDSAMSAETSLLRARALAAVGDSVAAKALVNGSEMLSARLLHAQLLLDEGNRAAAKPLLMTIIEDYNEDRIKDSDSEGMAHVGRAAHLLRSPEDANDAFNAAERATAEASFQTLLWRVELFLEHHDIGHAEEVLDDVLERNPHQPQALVLLGQVKLAQTLDFDEARRLAEHALRVNPSLTAARAVLAGIALHDMHLEQAEAEVARGLKTNPHDLHLLSLRGATRFLADDAAGFEQVRDLVLSRNPEYTRFFTTVSVYAEWEHRYDDIVRLMNHALTIDPLDPAVNAQLGLNLIRNGDDTGGLMALRTAFALDPYNVRVFNTLNLYEKTIARDYTDVRGERFNFRYPTREKAVLEKFVPQLLNSAWDRMVDAYQFTPAQPVGIELYDERENFAVRTSGLPQTAIQGVCFGKTLASMSPYYEKFNVGMTLWHELAHVFHIQLSANHVPRWFTEGLAEYETLIARPEWRREQDTELYLAFKSGRLPKVSAMNEAFTRAEDISDVAVAYYASTQIVRMLVEQYGYAKIRDMLQAWAQGKTTAQVFEAALGVDGATIDRHFEAFLSKHLARYERQFVPDQRSGNPERVRERAEKNQKDPDALSRYAVTLMQAREYEAAAEVVREVLRLSPKHVEGQWLNARLAVRRGDGKSAKAATETLLALGKDGYETQLLSSRAAEMLHDEEAMEQALTRAHEFDPSQADALYGLLEVARRKKDDAAEQAILEELAGLEEHNGTVFRSLVHALLDEPNVAAERLEQVGLSAIYSDMYDPASHVAYALALEKAGRYDAATEAFEVALLTPGSQGDLAKTYGEFADYSERRGRATKARQLRQRAKQLHDEEEKESADPEDDDAER